MGLIGFRKMTGFNAPYFRDGGTLETFRIWYGVRNRSMVMWYLEASRERWTLRTTASCWKMHCYLS